MQVRWDETLSWVTSCVSETRGYLSLHFLRRSQQTLISQGKYPLFDSEGEVGGLLKSMIFVKLFLTTNTCGEMFSDQFDHFLLSICISCFEFDCVSCHDCPAKVLFEGDITPRTGSLWLLPPSLEKTKQSTPSPVILLIGQQRIINVEMFLATPP